MKNLVDKCLILVLFIMLFSCKTITISDDTQQHNLSSAELIRIPAGAYRSGKNNTVKFIYYDYLLMKYPVTNIQYINFLKEASQTENILIDSTGVHGYYSGDKFVPPGLYQYVDFTTDNPRIGFYPPDIYFIKWRFVEKKREYYDLHPVINVTWFGANAFAKFYGMRLPTAEEWEKAASGSNGYDYPWGDNFLLNYANYKLSGDPYDNDTTPVGYYNGDNNTNNSYSPYGIYDMAGNVWEWTSSWWRDSSGKVIKGGSFDSSLNIGDSDSLLFELQTWFEPAVGYLPSNINSDIGFRCVKDISD